MILLDVAVGSRVRIYTSYDTPSSRKTDETVDAWVVAGINVHPDSYNNRILLGWKPGEEKPTIGWSVAGASTLLPPDRSIVNGYTRGYWAASNTLVERILTGSATGATGMFCRGCKDWNPYAVPNRPSNNFVCWSCRQGFVPKDW